MNLIEDLIREVEAREEAGVPVNRIPEVIEALKSRKDKIDHLFSKININKKKDMVFEAQNRFKEKIEQSLSFGGPSDAFKCLAKKALKQYYQEIASEKKDA